MRIMVDTNVLVSAVLNPSSAVSGALMKAMQKHTLVICTYILEELQTVFLRKFPSKLSQLDVYLTKMSYELCYTPQVTQDASQMRDVNDQPILQAAIEADVDAILTGDKDFIALDIERPVIITPSQFLAMD